MSEHAETPVAQRIARVLAGWRLSGNAEGWKESAGPAVDREWPSHLPAALAILRAIREADGSVAAAGDGDGWTRMITAAIREGEAAAAPLPPAPAPAPESSRIDRDLAESFPASDPLPASPGTD
ncbi:MAG: hypothetical protein SNJ79_13575 [Sphingomonadaceae bacterium]